MRQLLALSVLAAAAGTSAFASVDTALLNLVPPDTKVVGFVDVAQARNSQFGQFFLNRIDHEDEHFRQFVTETGFDPRRDLQDFLVAATTTGSSSDSRFAILARGVFNPARIEAASKSRGGVIQSYQGVELIVSKQERQSTAVAFLDPKTAVMADVATLKTIIANRGTATTLDPALSGEIDRVAAENDAWFVSTSSGVDLAARVDSELKEHLNQTHALQSILEASGGIRFGSSVTVSLDAKTRSPQDATSLADVARFLTSMLQTQRQNDPRAAIIASALDKMVLDTNGNSMHLSFSISEKNLEQLAELGPEQHRALPAEHKP